MRRLQKLIVNSVATLSLALAFTPQPAKAHVVVGVGFGCCGYYGPGWGYPYYPRYAYGYPSYYYYAPPPVVYAPPPTVVYAAPPATQADQTSPTYIDGQGRTCRQFQATSAGPQAGTACLQTDGTWRTVP